MICLCYASDLSDSEIISFRRLVLGFAYTQDESADFLENRKYHQYAKYLTLSEGFRQLQAFRDIDQKSQSHQNITDSRQAG